MRYLLTLLFAALSLNAVGQGIPQLPYNPDATEDGFIGSPDLLELLSLYGEEFSSAILSEDQESAIMSMGNMIYPLCYQACDNLPGFWNIATLGDLGLVWDEISPYSAWLKKEDGNTLYYAGTTLHTITTLDDYKMCYCATKELPKVEYKIITYGAIQDVETIFNTHAQEGWRAMAAPNGNNSAATMWRWAE